MNRTDEFKLNSNNLNNKNKSIKHNKTDQPIELNKESIDLLDSLNNLNRLIKSINKSSNFEVIDEEITSILKLSSQRLKLFDKKIEATLSTSFVDNLLGISNNSTYKQHQYGKLISLNSLLVRLSNKYQRIQKQRIKRNTFIPEYNKLEDVNNSVPTNSNQLTPQQIQQFDKESDELIASNKQDLLELDKAQHSLLSITNLQSEIMTHLTQQSHLVDQLYDDSLTSTGSLNDASKQLFNARNNQSSSRKFIIAFFFIAGFSLLFLE